MRPVPEDHPRSTAPETSGPAAGSQTGRKLLGGLEERIAPNHILNPALRRAVPLPVNPVWFLGAHRRPGRSKPCSDGAPKAAQSDREPDLS